MSDPIVAAAKTTVAGIKEALAVGKEIDQLTAEISELGKAEVAARSAFRQRQRVVNGDTTIVSALQEYERLKSVKDVEAELRAKVIEDYGKEAWDEILKIKQRKIKEMLEERDEYGNDLKKLKELKWWSFAFGLVCVVLLKVFGLL